MDLNGVSIVFLLATATMLLFLPRRWAPLPLLFGACYMTLGQGVALGAIDFPIIRILVAVGFFRVALRREWIAGGTNGLDWLFIVWALWALYCSGGHGNPSEALIFRLGLAYNVCGTYFLFRIFCNSFDDLVTLCRFVAILLMPVALEMVAEVTTGHNFFSIFGGVPEAAAVREGRVRAQGPFEHAILAGTVGAVCFPFMIGLWHKHKKTAVWGIAGCLLMVVASASSGPLLSTAAAIVALFMWHWRHRMRLVRWLVLLGYIGLNSVMLSPAYYLLGRIDLTGGSTGWHRAELIHTAMTHLNEWWLWGTDYTRHWMATGVSWSPDHTDITNYYIHLGVIGGLPLMILYIIFLVKGFSYEGKILETIKNLSKETQFFFWAIGASLFAHVVTGISVSYFDQSYIFVYITLAMISSAWSVSRPIIPKAQSTYIGYTDPDAKRTESPWWDKDIEEIIKDK